MLYILKKKLLIPQSLRGMCSHHLTSCPGKSGSQAGLGLEFGNMMASLPQPGKDELPQQVAQDFTGLSLVWDNTPEIRQRLRQGGNLLVHYDNKLKKETNFSVEKNTYNVKANKAVLKPVCHIIQTSGKLPDIEALQHQVEQVFSLHNVSISYKTLRDQAWSIRHLISTLKSSVRPPKPGGKGRIPKDQKIQTTFLIVLIYNLLSPGVGIKSMGFIL